MRAVRLQATSGQPQLRHVEEDPPAPGPGEVQMRVRASSLNFHDQLVVAGKIPSADGRIPMADGAGKVLAVGEGVEQFRPGDQVMSTFYPDWRGGEATPAATRIVPGEVVDGYACEVVCRSENAFTLAPDGFTAEEAATLPTAGVTAWRALTVAGRVAAGETVLILGTGGVSLLALQFAKMAGARVIATSSSDDKLEKLRQLGADEVINYQSVPDWGRQARDLTGGRGVDHVMEVGGPATLAQSIAACRMGGHIAMIGLLTGLTAELSIPAIFSNQIRISGISIGSRQDQEDMVRALSLNRVRPAIDRRFPLAEIADAFRHYAAQHHFGKVALTL